MSETEIAELKEELQKLTARLQLLEKKGSPSATVPSGQVVPLDVCEVVLEASEKPVQLCHSAWSLPAVVGLTKHGGIDLAFSCVLLLCNIIMQIMFIQILFSSSFLGSPFSSQVSAATLWRTRSAHDVKFLDLADNSLVARVCAEDDSLLVSSKQAKLISDINNFLGLQKEEFFLPVLPPGVQLCMLCIIVYNLCVFKELRTVAVSWQALWTIPRTSSTIFKENVFHSISYGRLVLLGLAHLVRFTLACMLYASGVQWLAATTSIVDLILNSVALVLILEIDEFLFAALVPTQLQLTIENLEPIKVAYHRCRSQRESLLSAVAMLGMILVPYFMLIQPMSQSMLDVKVEMCKGAQNFVVAYNAEVQMAFGYRTSPVSNQLGEQKLAEHAVSSFKFSQPLDEPSHFRMELNQQLFEDARLRGMRAQADFFPVCFEVDVLNSGGSLHNDPSLMPIVQSYMNALEFQFNMPANSSCADYLPYCDQPDSRLLRLACGHTCGCTDPLSKPWYKQPIFGCSSSCLAYRRSASEELSCSDVANEQAGESWERFWDGYFDAISAYYGAERFKFSSFSNATVVAMKANGCAQLHVDRLDPVVGESYCEGNQDLWGPLAYLCPVSCNCTNPNVSHSDALRRACPGSCFESYGYGLV